MSFSWHLIYEPPDPLALERMKAHFEKPSVPLPNAWFMTGEVTYFTPVTTTAPEALSAEELSEAIHEIDSGLRFFPESGFAADWQAWFRFLLPHSIQIVNSNTDNTFSWPLLSITHRAFLMCYPETIPDSYARFRDDVVDTLGTRALPQTLSRDDASLKLPGSASLQNSLFNDIWDLTNTPDKDLPGIDEYFHLPMLFCLKYLTPAEIDTWVVSFLNIDSDQWRLSILTWWLSRYHDHDQDITIPDINRDAFDAAFTGNLSRDTFLDWAARMKKHDTFHHHGETLPIGDKLKNSINQSLQDFERVFFRPSGRTGTS